MKPTAEDKKIWDQLYRDIGNPYGVAGLMGNLFAESSMNPYCITGSKAKDTTGIDYTNDVEALVISKDEFIHDGVAYGLAQWRYYSRKERLYDMAKALNLPLGAAATQITYLLSEIRTYKTVWNTLMNAKSVKEASDIVLEKYEKPANTSDAVKEKRSAYGMQYLDAFYPIVETVKHTLKNTYIVTTSRNVFVRTGNGTEYTKIRRINKEGTKFPWVATSANNWHAIKIEKYEGIAWISGDYSKMVIE